jgi:hypothetical protein
VLTRCTSKAVACATALAASATLVGVGGSSATAVERTVDPAAAPPGRTATTDRGDVVSVKHVLGMTRRRAQAYLAERGLPAPAPTRGVDVYRVAYRTVDAHREPARASGLLVLPRGDRTRLRTVSYQHGTNPTRDTAASVDPASPDRTIAVLFGGAGFGTVAPDYLGLGTGTGRHPYMDHSAEATATLDLLAAGRTVARRHGRKLSRRVRVTGFSQGGPATMAAAQVLQRRGRLAAVAPVAGPYDVEATQVPATLYARGLDPQSGVFYFSYWLTAMDRVHDIYDSPRELFRAPYARRVERLFDGTHALAEIIPRLPRTVDELLTPEAEARLTNPTGGLARALRSNDRTCEWHSRAPVRLYAAHGDREVAFANSKQCEKDLRDHGSQVRLLDVGATGHTGSVLRSMPRIVRWFASAPRHATRR